MTGEQRREAIVKLIGSSSEPVSGQSLAKKLGVSRQVIVQDMALLRANGYKVTATHKGYVADEEGHTRVFKVIHTPEEVEKELYIFVDNGGTIEDVFVYHKVYGVVKADMNIRSRIDAKKYLEQIKSGASTLLSAVTGGYHYHTVSADSEENLDLIQEELKNNGMLAKLQDYEPVDFWKED